MLPHRGVAFAFVILSSWATVAAANDASFGGAGADLVPLTETRVRLQSEDVLIVFREGRWHVEARYVFVNDAPDPVTLQVGFPELRCLREIDCAESAFDGLATVVDGNPVEHRQGHLDASAELADYLGVVWLYDVTFPPRVELTVEHRYSMQTGANMMFYRFTSYVTRTGTRWAGPIGRARFTVRFPPYAHTIGRTQGITSQGIKLVETGEGAPYVETTYESRDWVPTSDLHFSFNASTEMAQGRLPETTPPGAQCPNLFDPAEAEKPDCRNVIYGTRGYPFANEALREYFFGQGAEWRLTPDPHGMSPAWARAPRMFTAFEESWIDYPDDSLLESYELAGEPPPRWMPDATTVPEPDAKPETPPNTTPPPTIAPRQGRCGCGVPGAPTRPGLEWLGLGLLAMRRRRLAS